MPGQHSLYKWSTAFSSAGKTHQKQLRKQPLEVFSKKGVLKSFAIFKGKHLLGFLFNTAASPQTSNFTKKRIHHKCFAVK